MTSANRPEIRKFGLGDVVGVRRCIVELQDYCRRLDPQIADGESIADKYLEHLLSECRSTEGTLLVAEHEAEIVGLVCVFSKVRSTAVDEEEYQYAYISDLVVLPSHRKTGLGRALLEAAERYAQSKGASLLRLSVISTNFSAREFYRDYGFNEKVVVVQKKI